MKKQSLLVVITILTSLGTSNVMSHNKTLYLNNSNTFEIKNKLMALSKNLNKNTNSQIKFTDYEIASLGLAEMKVVNNSLCKEVNG